MKKFLLLIISLVNAGVTAIYIAFTPSVIIPTHYGADGKADAFSSKWTIMMMPCILILFGAIYLIYRLWQEKSFTANENKKYEEKAVAAIFLFLFVCFWILQIVSLNGITEIGSFVPQFICFIVGALMVFLCNMFAKIKQNSFFGIKTNATLKSEAVWKKTHRLGGYLGVLGGFAVIACGIAGLFASDIALVLMAAGVVIFLVLACVIPVVYAEVLYGREKKNNVNRD